MVALAFTDEEERLLDDYSSNYDLFRPRPDNLEMEDEQHSFVFNDDPGVAWHIAGNGAGSSEMAANKIARFVIGKQAPPRFDTPFWIIGETYEQVIGCIWKEKLLGHGHIPESEIDWDRIGWYDVKQQLPMTVPLKPWPAEYGGDPKKNWVLEFKSYEQGYAKMQARSIGGFCFSEQFPWSLLLEVLRGCREYNFSGAKFCEFTPIDPAKSVEIETMIEEDSLPKGWAIYGGNTECAMEAGHVDPDWYEEFFGAVSEEMQDTRKKGRFASYEGSIYPSFNPNIHATKKGQRLVIPQACQHRRAIDWGSGPEHAFVCLWGAKTATGDWYIYDEYWSTSQNATFLTHCDEIIERWEWPDGDMRHGVTYADPSEPSWMRVFSQKMGIQAARNSVMSGIEAVRCALKIDANGHPGIIIDRDACPNLMREMRTYRWKRSTGKGANPQDAKPEPLKRDDHAVDALRYLVLTDQSESTGGPAGRRVTRPVPKHIGFKRATR